MTAASATRTAQHEGRDPEADCEKREERIDRHRFLDRHERVAPDRGDTHEREHRREARPDHPRRLLAGRPGATARGHPGQREQGRNPEQRLAPRPSTGSVGLSTICGSRSPTAATSAASTACRRKSSAAATGSWTARTALVRGDRAARPGVCRARCREGPDHRRRAAAAARPGGSHRPSRGARRARRRADDERRPLAPEGRGARGCRPPPGDREPRLTRRRNVPRHERRRISRSPGSSRGSPPHPRPA